MLISKEMLLINRSGKSRFEFYIF